MPKKATRKPDTTNQARLIQLVHLIKQLQPVPFKVLMERLEVSRATLRRDFDLLRDRLNMPIVYDRDAGGYAISERTDRYGDRFELPGLWLTADEAYAFLTLYNVLGKIDPGILSLYVTPLRGLIKQILGDKKFDMLGLNDKIVIELGDFKKGRQSIFDALSKAVMNEYKVHLQFTEDLSPVPGEYWLERFVLTPHGWDVEGIEIESKERVRLPVININSVNAI